MSGTRFPSTLQALVIVNTVTVLGLAVLSRAAGITPGILILAALVIAATEGACLWVIWKKPEGTGAAAPGSSEAIETLRRETADNFGVIQKDIHSLGAAVIRRLDTPDESDGTAALNGAMTDLAISLAEARETLGTLAAELAEVKSVAFEMQAQLDQQADALRAFEHSVERIHPDDAPDAGEGAAPGSLGKALAVGVSGAAVARLIGNGFHAAPPAADPIVTEVAADIGSEDDAPWPDTDTGETVEVLAPALAETAEVTGAPPAAVEATSEAEETDDWLSMGIDDDDDDGRPVAAEQTALLDIGESADSRRKPRRPGKHDTALVAHVMIGIGNKPYLRGHGPGLSPDKGVPMEYVDVGRWQWIAPESGSPLTVTLWKNDDVPAAGDPVGVPSGMTLEIHPHFTA